MKAFSTILGAILLLPLGFLVACNPVSDSEGAPGVEADDPTPGFEEPDSDLAPEGQPPSQPPPDEQPEQTPAEPNPQTSEDPDDSETLEPEANPGDEPEDEESTQPEQEQEQEQEQPEETPERRTARSCFTDIEGELGPDYDRFEPQIGDHCQGTAHQQIEGVERLVFLGDSVTAGTPPTMPWEYYSARVTEGVVDRFGLMEVSNCAQWGARTDDLLIGKRELEACFPDGGDERRTLVIMTIGGNDIAAWAQDHLGNEAALREAEAAALLLEEAIEWLQEPGRFPNGVFVVFANPYEYTDATGDLAACPLAGLAGMEGNWIEGAEAVIHFQERFLQIAVNTGTDMIFSLERFCGHGFRRDDPSSQCYRGPDAELWFDLTCIHPNPAGHAVLADMFLTIVDG